MTDRVSMEPVAQLHSNGELCIDRQIVADEWPVYLVTVAQLQAAEQKGRREALLQVIQRLNANTYNLTKAECVEEIHAIIDGGAK